MAEIWNKYANTAARTHGTPGRNKRPKSTTIDAHTHIAIPQAGAFIKPHLDVSTIPLARFSSEETAAVNAKQEADIRGCMTGYDERFKMMDEMGVDMQMTMPPPPQLYHTVALEYAVPAARMINDEDIKARAIDAVEQHGIVFLDEIDKITRRAEVTGADVSREGVQRDLLPLVEGCTVTTKYGMVRTDHVLFIASGAFHMAKPSDLIPELQGRLPIRVELDALSVGDFVRILTEPDASLTEQYVALLGTEGVNLRFHADGIARLAEIAWQVNERTENIGARRLHTVMERLMENVSFEAGEGETGVIEVDRAYVDAQLAELASDEDLSRYIL